MNDLPNPVARYVGPPDMQRLSGGQRILEDARNDLANHLDREIISHKVVLDNAQAELQSNIDYVVANGEVALQNARQSLDRRINLTLGNAAIVASQYGVELPHVSEIRTRSSYPPPAILQASPGNSPVPPINELNPYGSWKETPKSPQNGDGSTEGEQYTCDTQLLPETQREDFRFLWFRGLEVDSAVIAGPVQLPSPFVPGPIFTAWFKAHLACKLVNECGWNRDRLGRHVGDIEQVQLANPQAYVGAPDVYQVCQWADDNWK